MRTISVCAGIGDNIWLLQKLINAKEQFNFKLPDGKPQRGAQIFELLPQVCNTVSYVPGLSYKTLAAKTEIGRFTDIRKQDFYLSCNAHLEAGRKLVDFLPDLPISYKLDWKINDIPYSTPHKRIGIYSSAYSTQRAWAQYGSWGVQQWLQLIKLIHAKDSGYLFTIIGAEWDTDFSSELMKKLAESNITYENTIGQPIDVVMQYMRIFDYAFYFPSGLPILSETIEGGSDCTMFYTTNIKKILGTWADPERIANGNIKECLFCSPAAIFDWCVNNGKI